jgi:hypothetical protein
MSGPFRSDLSAAMARLHALEVDNIRLRAELAGPRGVGPPAEAVSWLEVVALAALAFMLTMSVLVAAASAWAAHPRSARGIEFAALRGTTAH